MLRTTAHRIRKSATTLFLVLIGVATMAAQPRRAAKDDTRLLKIAELNCENLFDTLHTEGHEDNEFLPDSKRAWTSYRYWRKLRMVAREIASLGHPAPIDLVALTEVEGDTVMRDLTLRTPLREVGYRYIITTGGDPRGINVALLYREGSFRLLNVRELNWSERVSLPQPTRHTLHAQGIVRSGDTIDIFVCHLPSRHRKKRSRYMRQKICNSLRTYIDSLTAVRPEANIILIGDMNDSPRSPQLTEHLAKPLSDMGKTTAPRELYNISTLTETSPEVQGTYRFHGRWEMLDQCIVNGRLLERRSRLRLAPEPLRVAAHSFLLESDRQHGGLKPWRTFQGPRYRGGFSDHLPIVVEFQYASRPHRQEE